jgi:twitching motility protein PilT
MSADDTTAALKELMSLLSAAVDAEASDLHLLAGAAPRMRVHGRLRTEGEVLDGAELESMLKSVCPTAVADNIDRDVQAAARRKGGELRLDLDFSYAADVAGQPRRFRFNVFYAHGRLGACVRLVHGNIPSPEWAGLPQPVLDRMIRYRNGLILVTGVAGSGKSTTLAIYLDQLVRARGCRVITIEEPIEHVHTFGDNALITQREVGVDVPTFADGLKYGLRQDPDVIMVGEIRDRETAQMALTAAETGHLVLSTMHTRDAKGAVSRYTDLFPRNRSEEICAQLATNLRAVVSQHLLPNARKGAKRALAIEVLFNNLPVSAAIRSNNLVTIGDAVLTGKADGMITLDESLIGLYANGEIALETALEFANNRTRLESAILHQGIVSPQFATV